MKKSFVTLLVGIVVGYKGISLMTHLVYLSTIGLLTTYIVLH